VHCRVPWSIGLTLIYVLTMIRYSYFYSKPADRRQILTSTVVISYSEIFAKRKRPLIRFLAKPSWNAEAVLKTYVLFIYGDVYYITNLFYENLLKIATP
jgi:hypothetical protein